MNFMNPSQVKIMTTPWEADEERTLTKKQLDLLCGGGSIVRVVAPGPYRGSWVVTKVNQASIQLSSQVGPEGRLLPDQPADTKFTLLELAEHQREHGEEQIQGGVRHGTKLPR